MFASRPEMAGYFAQLKETKKKGEKLFFGVCENFVRRRSRRVDSL